MRASEEGRLVGANPPVLFVLLITLHHSATLSPLSQAVSSLRCFARFCEVLNLVRRGPGPAPILIGSMIVVMLLHEGDTAMQKRYGALKIIGTLFKVLGVIGGTITTLAAVGFCAISLTGGAVLGRILGNSEAAANIVTLYGGVMGVLLGIVVLIFGGIIALFIFAAGDGIYLLVALEENTRLTSILLQQQHYQSLSQSSPVIQTQPIPASG